MSADKPFTRENLDSYLRELAKEFRKKNGSRMPAEITLIGGASILINYGFREMTYDMDAIIKSCRKLEPENREALVVFRENYPGVLNGDNLADILKAAREKQQ